MRPEKRLKSCSVTSPSRRIAGAGGLVLKGVFQRRTLNYLSAVLGLTADQPNLPCEAWADSFSSLNQL